MRLTDLCADGISDREKRQSRYHKEGMAPMPEEDQEGLCDWSGTREEPMSQ